MELNKLFIYMLHFFSHWGHFNLKQCKVERKCYPVYNAFKSQRAHELQFAFFSFFFYKSGNRSCCSNTLRTNILTFTAEFESLWNIKLKRGTEFRGLFSFSKTGEISPSPADARSQGRGGVSFTILRRESWVISVPPDYFWKLFLLHWPESKPPK